MRGVGDGLSAFSGALMAARLASMRAAAFALLRAFNSARSASLLVFVGDALLCVGAAGVLGSACRWADGKACIDRLVGWNVLGLAACLLACVCVCVCD